MKQIIVFLSCACIAFTSPAVTVLPFDDLSAARSYANAGTAIAELLVADLGRVKGLTLVERREIEKTMKEVELGMSGIADDKTAPKIGKMLGAAYLIVGSYLLGPTSSAVWKVITVETGVIAKSGRVDASADVLTLERKVFRAVAAAVSELIPGLTIPPDDAQTGTLDAVSMNSFGEALAAERTGDSARAREIIKKLIENRGNMTVLIAVLRDIERRIEESDRRREEALKRAGQTTTDWNTFMRTTTSFASSMRYSALLAYCLRARTAPPKAPEGSMIGADEMTDYYIVFSYAMLKRSEEAAAEGGNFLTRYPSSMYYASVKNYMTEHMNIVKDRDAVKKRTEAKITAIRAEKNTPEMLAFRTAGEYFSAKLYDQALALYRSISLAEIEKQGVTPDTVLYFMFTCCHGLLQKENAQRLLSTVENLYPESSYLASMRTMMNYMPE